MVRLNDLQAVKAVTVLTDGGATANFVDNELIPEAEVLVLDYTVLYKPNEIVTTGQYMLLEIATANP